MKQIQEQRPNEQQFVGAALRYGDNQYPSESEARKLRIMIMIGNALNYQQVPIKIPSRREDEEILTRERCAEGFVVGEETLEVFARRQLQRYIQLRTKGK